MNDQATATATKTEEVTELPEGTVVAGSAIGTEAKPEATEAPAKVEGKTSISRLQALLNEDPDAGEDPAIAKAIAGLEQRKADRVLAPAKEKLAGFMRKLIADGTIPGDQVDSIDLFHFVRDANEDGSFKDIHVEVRNRRPASSAGTRASAGSGVSKVTQKLMRANGFEAFVVGGREFSKPKEAIAAAGGSPKMKDGVEISENYWRAIMENGYLALPIEVKRSGEVIDRALWKQELLGVPVTS